MDKLKAKTIKDYTAWDVDCPFVCMMHKTRKKLKTIFKRKAKRNLKREIMEEIYDG